MIIKADLHIHSDYSNDSYLKLHEILLMAKKRGIGAVAIADHNRCDILGEIQSSADQNSCIDGIVVIPAAELSTDAGHILGLFLEREIDITKCKKSGEVYSAEEVLSQIKAAGGIAILAHPYGKPSWSGKQSALKLLDGIECYNARAASNRQDANREAAVLAFERGKLFTAGSDAHFAGEIGNAWLELTIKEKSLSAVRAALVEKRGTVCGRESPLSYRGLSQVVKRIKSGQILKVSKRLLVVIYYMLIDLAKTTRLLRKDRGSKLVEGGNLNVGNR